MTSSNPPPKDGPAGAPDPFRGAAKKAALFYETGKRLYVSPGHSSDGLMAANYFERAALLGYPPAQRVLGVMYLEGDQVQRDPAKAAKWMAAAAERGDLQACFKLALMSATGDGTPKDWAKAYGLLTRPGVSALPEALELRRRLKSELTSLYPELLKALGAREGLFRASLDRAQGRRILPFLDPGADTDDSEQFEAWLDLNLGKITAEAALSKLSGLMEAYYRGQAALHPPQGKACP